MDYLHFLESINKKYNSDSNNFRTGNFNHINNILNKFYQKKFEIDKFLCICTILFNIQMFTDGNSRTIFNYMQIILSQHGYRIDLTKIINDYPNLRTFFPIIYDVNDEIDTVRMKKYIIRDYHKKLVLKKRGVK